MKILFAATPAAGHLNPLLAIARMALARGDEALVATAGYLRPSVEKSGARFLPLAAGADIDLTRIEDVLPERASLPPGPEQLRYNFERIFLDPMPPQAETLRRIIASERPNIIVVDDLFFGATALFLDEGTPRPPIVACSITIMVADRPDGAPTMIGLPPARDEAARAAYAAIAIEAERVFGAPVRAYADAKLAEMGLPPLPCSVLHSRHLMADAVLQTTVPAFEYDFGGLPDHVRFVGALPPPPQRDAALPDWWGELDGSKQIVLVTQGTVANTDLGELIEPTLSALGTRDDLLVLVTTGFRSVGNIRGPIPKNARLAEFLDFAVLLPKVDVLVTNGGYGTVQLALQAGVPIVAAGRTEDKAEVGARVAWSGVGIEIPSQRPEARDLRAAVDRVLTEPSFAERARAIAADMAAIDTPAAILETLDRLVAESKAT
ncbi:MULTISPECIES: glycosyltransferase [Methylobacterium]|uniref:glycosyltransferase n=1 Tax=Methylobacterium TaxID=407 RepID=UPI0011C6FBE3|nr:MULTISPECIES: nucleotide disphospho-sugar-binding domain-containing protein [Methylobacterium]TXN44640.1 glycosyltransferase [Methylobacterium sp. WL7]GJE24752.1 4'-demethylrebeccamycin synthase [Methylobacterium mesophilicum]